MSIAVITGDIVNSRKLDIEAWLELLKKALSKYGSQPKEWEIFRGDSFQLEIAEYQKSLSVAIYLKATMKQLPGIDVRIAIGIGNKTFAGQRISESNGSAFIHSGEAFEKIGKRLLAINSGVDQLDYELNLYLELASTIMDNWSELTSILIKEHMDNPEVTQKELITLAKKNEQLARLMKRDSRVKMNTQSKVSEALSRGSYDLIQKLMEMFEKKLQVV